LLNSSPSYYKYATLPVLGNKDFIIYLDKPIAAVKL